MSAQLKSMADVRPMRLVDLDRVLEIEPELYSHPWTRGNFDDSLMAGYRCSVLECRGEMAGYGVLMLGVREAHLLNLSVGKEWQRMGYGRLLLGHFVDFARRGDALQVLLEVRPSNVAARRLYERFGFSEISIRRGYYPQGHGREDAILMGMNL